MLAAAYTYIAQALSTLPDFSAASVASLDTSTRDLLVTYLNLELLLDVRLDEHREPLFTRLRRDLVLSVASDANSPLHDLDLLSALAKFAFGTGYVLDETQEELAALRGLSLYGGSVQVAALACYQSLYDQHQPRWLLDTEATSPFFVDLLQHQLVHPLKEAELKSTIPSLSPITDTVSRDVQRMYEEHPYPRWTSLRISDRINEKRDILVAGCGSGRQAILWAAQNPPAHVVGLDLSRASLAYGLRKAQEFQIPNLEFVHGDILDAAKLGRQFDVVSCFGVLHHMANPAQGLRALRGVLADGGVLDLGLYSEIARQPVAHAIRLREQLGLSPTPEGIRALRQHILGLPPAHPAREVTRFVDFYTMSGCRDLMFHVQEHRFDLRSVERLLKDTGFRLRFLQASAATHEHFRRDVPGGDISNLGDWHTFELKNPTFFRAMYPIRAVKA